MADEGVSGSEQHAAKERVLNDAHAGLVGLRVHDLLRDGHQLFHLGNRLETLRNVHVHLVTIEVSIVRCGDLEVHPES